MAPENDIQARLGRRIEQLPMLPVVVTRLLALSPEDDDFFGEVLAVTSEDPPSAAMVIRAANSAESAPVTPIESLTQAITRLGVRKISGLIATMALAKTFVPESPAQLYLWAHAMEVAVGARVIANMRRVAEVDPDQAYLAGLLHDLGRFLMLQELAEELEDAGDPRASAPEERLEVERSVCGIDHSELGWQVCERLGIPSGIAEVVRDHHEYERADSAVDGDPTDQLIAIVQMADLLSNLCRAYPVIRDGELDEAMRVVAEKCTHPAWNDPPVQPDQLAFRLDGILVASQLLIDNLGLMKLMGSTAR